MSKARWRSGISEQMRKAVEFAESNGFEVDLTAGTHLEFKGHGVIVIGSTSPRNHFAAKQAMSRMKAAMKGEILPNQDSEPK